MVNSLKINGFSMVEVLVTMLILSICLLSLAGLQSKMQVSQIESYQRSQAIVIIKDIASRIETNRNRASSYVTTTPLGLGAACNTNSSGSTLAQIDANEICNNLIGAAEISGANKAGAMIGGLGCVDDIGNNEYMITLAWKGLIPISAPPASVSCGANLYDNGSPKCINDLCRRTLTTIIKIANVQ